MEVPVFVVALTLCIITAQESSVCSVYYIRVTCKWKLYSKVFFCSLTIDETSGQMQYEINASYMDVHSRDFPQ